MFVPMEIVLAPAAPPLQKSARPHYERAIAPPAIRLTDRDRAVIAAIHDYDGILADYQLRAMFFHDERYFMERMSFLFHNGYVAKPDRQRRAQLKYTVYWLDKTGAELLAGQQGTPYGEFKWRRPYERWNQVTHDVQTNDVRLAVTKALEPLPTYHLLEWASERDFHRHPDQVEYVDKNGAKQKRLQYPDGYFLLGWDNPGTQKRDKLRFLLEFDRGKHSGISFADEKVRPGMAYIQSPQFKARFGYNAGRWLVVIDTPDSALRLSFLKERTEAINMPDIKAFFFTTFEAVMTRNMLIDPIWQQAGITGAPVALLKTS
ncbi:MAG: replication-relaxation family protein [Chloroflexota bacterium]